jgi:hypothetical protein
LNEPQGSIILEHDLLPKSAELGVESLGLVNRAGLKIVSIEQCLKQNVHVEPDLPPNTTTPTQFPAPPPRQVQNDAATFVRFPLWILLLASMI